MSLWIFSSRAALVALAAAGLVATVGCGPSDACRRYVACQKASDPTVDTSAWDTGGSCWSTLQTANACTEQCRQAIEALAQLPDAPAACTATGAADAETDAGPG